MTQFFNRSEAIEVRSEVEIKFPQLRVWDVLDIHDENTGEYERSFFSVSYGESANFYINSQQQLDETLALCQYIASAIADNRQSEEVDSSDLIEMDGGFWCQVCQYFVEPETHIHKFVPMEAADHVDTLREF